MALPPFQRMQLDQSPAVAIGDGPNTLLVIPGMNDAVVPPVDSPRFWAKLFRGISRGRNVVVVGRPRGLTSDTTTRDMAAVYADIIRERYGVCDIMGVSFGGMIAQHLVLDSGECVRRLVLALTCAQPDEDKRTLYRKWHAWTASGRWAEAYDEMIAGSYALCGSDCATNWKTASPAGVLRRGIDPSDLEVSLHAACAHDTLADLPRITTPTLVLGAEQDLLMSAAASRTLAEQLPDARLHLVADAGHAALEQKPDECDRAVVAWLDAELPGR